MLVCDSPALQPDRPYNPEVQAPRFGLFRVRSPLLAESLLFSLPAGTEMVHFPALPSPTYVFSRRSDGITRRGFPHSDTPGSKLVCSSPRLIAAYHVLRRLLVPRHPPCALSSLTGISKVHSLCISQRLVFGCQRSNRDGRAVTPREYQLILRDKIYRADRM